MEIEEDDKPIKTEPPPDIIVEEQPLISPRHDGLPWRLEYTC